MEFLDIFWGIKTVSLPHKSALPQHTIFLTLLGLKQDEYLCFYQLAMKIWKLLR